MTITTPIDPTKLKAPPSLSSTQGVRLKDTPRPSLPAPAPAPAPAVAAPQKWSDAEWDSLRRILDDIQAARRPSKAAEASDMITACILNGADTTRHIIAALSPYGYSRGHVALMLTRGRRPFWRKDGEGRYALTEHHPLLAQAAEEEATRTTM